MCVCAQTSGTLEFAHLERPPSSKEQKSIVWLCCCVCLNDVVLRLFAIAMRKTCRLLFARTHAQHSMLRLPDVGELSNGLKVLTVPDESGMCGVGLFTRAGCRFENEKTCGMSWLLERMVCKGNTKVWIEEWPYCFKERNRPWKLAEPWKGGGGGGLGLCRATAPGHGAVSCHVVLCCVVLCFSALDSASLPFAL